MSQENVEIVRRAWEAYYSGDFDALLDLVAEDVEVHPDASVFPEATPFIGREEYRRFLTDIDSGWEGGVGGVINEAFAVGDRVVARGDWGGRGLASGIEIRSSLTGINTVRDGQIVKIEFFFDHAEALEAVGLSE